MPPTSESQSDALHRIANSLIVTAPVRTIASGLILAGIVLGVLGVALGFLLGKLALLG